jgi:hypothetical protein
MFTFNKYKWLLASLVVIAGEITTITPSMAQSPFNHDTSSIPTNDSPVHNSVPNNGINGNLDSSTGKFTINGLDNGFTISPDIIQAFLKAQGIDPSSSNTLTVCLSDPCLGSGEGTSISLNDLAKLMEEDLQKSFKDLAAAEADREPRRFARRRSTDCGITATQLREIVQSKLEASQKFAEQVKKLSPNNNVW